MTYPNVRNVLYLWPWAGPPLLRVQYVMYFRFCGIWHVALATCERRAEVVKIFNAFARGRHAIDFVVESSGSKWRTGAKCDVCDCVAVVICRMFTAVLRL